MVMTPCAAFSGAGTKDWALNVKNTFINFDPTAAPAARRGRSTSCPPPSRVVACAEDAYWEEATRELCHAMALRPYDEASQAKSKQATSVAAGKSSSKGKKNLDTISEVSTTSGDGSPRTDDSHSGTLASVKENSWTSMGSRKKPIKNCTIHEDYYSQKPVGKYEAAKDYKSARYDKRDAPATPSTPSTCAPSTPASAWATPKSKWYGRSEDVAEPAAPAQQARKYDGKAGKGLSHFQRIEVGIEDNRDFRVVQRLIGPKGKHMSDITSQAKGAKVWIIGRGSRSWEDDEGPLVVCVGATSKLTLDTALGAIHDLLAKVRAEHKKYYGL